MTCSDTLLEATKKALK